MTTWSQPSKLKAGLIVIAVLAILSSGLSFLASRSLIRSMATPATSGADLLAGSQALRFAGLGEVSGASASLLTGEEQYARAARSGSDLVRDRLARLGKQAVDPEGHSLLERIQTTEGEYREAFERALAIPVGRRDVLTTAAVGSRGAAFEQAMNALVTHMEPSAIGGLVATRASAQGSQVVFDLFTGLFVVLAVLLCVMLMFIINRGHREQTSALLIAEEGQTKTTMALDEAKATIHLKDQFLATVSHELRNPLAPILTWTQLLRSGTLEKAKAERGLEVIERNVSSLSELIDDLVDASRVVSGKFRLDVRPIDLVPVIKAATESQRPASDAKQIRMSLVLDERAGVISGDFERLQQVMGNLLANAIKFTPKGGRVQVVLGRVESHIEIRISDDGIGIDPSFLPHIFEPFQQEKDGSMRRHGGLGLGLSIVHHIVELHGGEIVAQSQGVGQGSAFTVKLPLLGAGEPTGIPLARHPKAGDGLSNVMLGRLDRVKVLLVDDEPNANEAVQALLDSCGAEVRVAGSAAQALQMLDVWKPDVLISDIAMPEEDGYVLIKKIRARSVEMNGNIPAAALTAYAKIEDRVSILAAGFQMYLSKPADPSELIAVVASLAARRRRSLAENPEAS
jgi:signal transduction histidine kinase/ActR/RegA family two-component response regulator